MIYPDFKYEEQLWQQDYSPIGIDEVGRGAFAGPVGIGAVSFGKIKKMEKEYLLSLGINDSKKLTAKKRLELSKILKQLCEYDVCFIDVETINKIGVGKATEMGMMEVSNKLKLKTKNPYLLIDAFEISNCKTPQKGIIRGDSLSISIAAASIIAKVERDILMENLSFKVDKYGFEKNKGYGTKFHRDAIKIFGATHHHRTDFIRTWL